MKRFEKHGVMFYEFESIESVLKYIETTPENSSFENKELASKRENDDMTRFCGTESLHEATDLMRFGWIEPLKEIEKGLKQVKTINNTSKKRITTSDVVGFQPNVSNYLMGLPNNMYNNKYIKIKDKVITVNKIISYPYTIKKEQIISDSIISLQLIKQLELKGYRVNLNIINAVEDMIGDKVIIKIRVKKAGERLNLSKLCFPMVHPSMLRRILCRVMETVPDIPRWFVGGYGAPMYASEITNCFDGEYLLPNPSTGAKNSIESLTELISGQK